MSALWGRRGTDRRLPDGRAARLKRSWVPSIWGAVAGSSAFLASTVALATGAGLLSSWAPAPDLPPLRPAPGVATEASPSLPITASDVVVTTSAGDVRATIVAPRDGTELGVVLVPGSGPADRDALRPAAERLARAGVAAITYDKRSDGYTIFHRDFDALADDAIQAADVLRETTGAARIGALGTSEGGWVVAIAAGRPDRPFDFVVLASAPVVTPLEQVSWTVDNATNGLPTFLRRATATALAGGRSVLNYLDVDPREALARSDAPVFAVWGAEDGTVPVNEAYRRLAAAAGPDRLTARIIPSAGHDTLAHVDGWLPEVVAWMRAPHAGPLTGVEPASTRGVAHPPPTTWFTDPRLHLALSLAVGVMTGWGVARRLRPVNERTVA